MQCPGCNSGNVQSLPLFYKSLPQASVLRGQYAPPVEVQSQYWIALLAVLTGIAFLINGAILVGLLLPLGGLAYGAINHASVEEYRVKFAKWSNSRIIVSGFQPCRSGRAPSEGGRRRRIITRASQMGATIRARPGAWPARRCDRWQPAGRVRRVRRGG